MLDELLTYYRKYHRFLIVLIIKFLLLIVYAIYEESIFFQHFCPGLPIVHTFCDAFHNCCTCFCISIA